MRSAYLERAGQPCAEEGLRSPMQFYVVDLCAADVYDAADGDVEAPTGWFARLGRWLVWVDGAGFWHAERTATRQEACAVYAGWADEYHAWEQA